MLIGQIFGSMPVQGILCKEIDSLKFSWTSFRTIYTTFFLISGTIEAGMVTFRLVRMGLNLNYAQEIIFFVSSMIRSFLLFHMARKWKTIMKYWTQCEYVFLRPPYKELKWSLTIRIRIIGVFFILMCCSKFLVD